MSTPEKQVTRLLAGVRSATATFPTLDDIKAALGIPAGDTTKDQAITNGMLSTVAMIETYLGRGIAYADESQQFEPIDTRDPKLFLWRFPVDTVAEVIVEGSPVTGWRVYPRQGVIDLGRGCCTHGPRQCCDEEPLITVRYTGGYPDDAWPPDLLEAVMRAFYGRWNATGGNIANTTGNVGPVKSWSADGLSVTMAEASSGMGAGSSSDVIPPDLVNVAAMLDPYRVRFVRGV